MQHHVEQTEAQSVANRLGTSSKQVGADGEQSLFCARGGTHNYTYDLLIKTSEFLKYRGINNGLPQFDSFGVVLSSCHKNLNKIFCQRCAKVGLTYNMVEEIEGEMLFLIKKLKGFSSYI